MDNDLLTMEDFKNICRLCLHSTGSMSEIFATYGQKSMQQQIFWITGLAIKEGDGLPSKICHRCRHVIEQACELRDVVNKCSKILSARTALENVEKFTADNDFDIETFLENTKEHQNDSDDDTIIIENYLNGSQDDTQEGRYIEEYVALQETENDFTENCEDVITEPALVPRRNNYRKKPPAHLICQLCLNQFATEENVRAHVEEHYVGSDLEIYLDITKRPFLCTFCDEVQLNKPQLVKHHRRHLSVNPYVCKHPGCSYKGKDRDGLRHHRVVHEAPSRVCDQCGGTFRRRSDLISHITRIHPLASQTRLSSHVCASCGLRSRNELALHRHMKAHHFAPRYPCPYGACERAYRSRRELADHERAHRGERRYRCPLCNVADGGGHMKMHDRSRMSKCDKCPLTFEDYGAFYRHRIAHHGVWQPHRCRACNQGYQSESQLEKHEQKCERLKRLLEYEQEHKNGDTDTQYEIEEQSIVGPNDVNGLEID